MDASLIVETLKTAVDNNSAADNPPRYNWRVTPSSLGSECVAQQWYKFRWVVRKLKPGRIARLFNRGGNEEKNFSALLRRAGWEVRDYTRRLGYHPESDSYITYGWDETPEPLVEDVSDNPQHIAQALKRDKWLLQQWRVKLFSGHMSGYGDAKGRHPEYTNNQWILLEYKTYNTKRFSHLTRNTLEVADPEYYIQVLIYLKELDLPWCLFCAVNKNDDDIEFKIVMRDDAKAEHYIKTAHTVIFSKARPARLAESPAYHGCKFCDFLEVCHLNAPVDINCRSCVNCTPIDGGKFKCDKWGAVIPGEKEMLAGCPSHTPVR